MNDMNALPVAATYQIAEVNSAASMILGPAWERIQSFGAMMAKGSVTVPQHFRGKEADCCAVAMQALGWGMNPFAVAQKTHVTQGGQIGYESQLINAVIQNSGALASDPDYEWFGPWEKIVGKVIERTSENTKGKYYVPGWKAEDEAGLGIKVRATLRGESNPRELVLLLAQCYPRFSTQWATDPKQQIAYLALRKFVRLHKPGVIMGVYTNEELDDTPPPEKFMGTVQPEEPKGYSQADFDKNFPVWEELIKKNKKTADQIITTASTKGKLSAEQITKLRAVKAPQTIDAEPVKTEAPKADAPKTDSVVLEKRIREATDIDLLQADADLISTISDQAVRDLLTGLYKTKLAELKGGEA